MKFKDMPYRRITTEEVHDFADRFISELDSAGDAQSARTSIMNMFKEEQKVETALSLCYTRYTIDTRDEFYTAEQAYYDEHSPIMQNDIQRIYDKLLESRFRPELETSLGSLLFRKLENRKRIFNEKIIPELQEENRLITEYSKLIGGAELEFDGEKLNLAQMMPYRTSSDRAVRKAANEKYYGFFAEKQETLDELYDKLVHVRDNMAKKLGFNNFVEMGYARMERFDYDAEMVKKFRDEVKENMVPIVKELKERQRRRLGVDELYYYDLDCLFPSGNPRPVGTPEELVEKARKMYHELSPETGEFFDYMVENELLDLLAKPGKTGGGYCTAFPDYKAPFIFANFAGTKDDVDVLTHEAGHAFQGYLSMREIEIPAYYNPTYESCEIHSMSMELITRGWMDRFFGDQTQKFLYMQLEDIVCFVPYGCMVDEFQHIIYTNPDMTPEERDKAWLELESQYMPYMKYDGMEYLEKGGRWQRQSHIYEMAFYYIDYTLAQICAVQFFVKFMYRDPQSWNDYLKLCRAGGTRTFLDLVKYAGIQSPFQPEVLKKAVNALKRELDRVDDTKL